MNKERNFIEIFAGCGGLSTGLEMSGWKPILLVDNDKVCTDILRKNKKDDVIIECLDATKLNLSNHKGKVDLLAGGIPCQAFSQAGLRKGVDDPRGALFHDFIRMIKEVEPRIFLIENVAGLLTHNNKETFTNLSQELTCNGRYKVCNKLLNANDYDVPQNRKRVFIIGYLITNENKDSNFEYPTPVQYKPTLKDALKDCPESFGAVYPESKKKILELVPPGGCWINLPEEIQKQYMGKAYFSGGGKRGMARRLSWDSPSLTLTTSPCQKQTERIHPDFTRPLTVREYARIQTFPDDFQFSGSMGRQYKAIGNAVPVKLAYHIGKKLLEFHNHNFH